MSIIRLAQTLIRLGYKITTLGEQIDVLAFSETAPAVSHADGKLRKASSITFLTKPFKINTADQTVLEKPSIAVKDR